MSAYFITATGTGIGKTYLTELLVKTEKACAIKPIMSGFSETEETDTHKLMRAQGITDYDVVSPWRFAAALSPDAAAAREGKEIDFKALTAFCRKRIADQDRTLIEGVGGTMVPLTARHTVIDWISALHIPAILVAGSYLGTLSHTLTAVTALRQKHIPLHAIVISESEESPMPMEETAATIERFTGINPLLLKRNAKKIGLVL